MSRYVKREKCQYYMNSIILGYYHFVAQYSYIHSVPVKFGFKIMFLIAIICWSSLFLISCSPTKAFTSLHRTQSSGVGLAMGQQKQWAADKTRFFDINVPPHFGLVSSWMSPNSKANRTVHGFEWGLTLHESGPPTLALFPVESAKGIQSIPAVECQNFTLI